MMANKINYDISLLCKLPLKFGKITSGFILIERWEAGNYHIISWPVASKAKFSSERLFVFFLKKVFIYTENNHLLAVIPSSL